MKTKGTEASNCADSGVGMNEAADSEIERWNWTRNIVLEIENWIPDNIVLGIEIQKWILNHIVLEIDKWIPDDIVLEIENENQTMNEI